MSLPSILVSKPPAPYKQDPTFAFEHAQAHRRLLGSMAPLTRFSALPYLLSPYAVNGGMWHRDHQQAHSDSQDVLPGYFGGTGFGQGGEGNISLPIPVTPAPVSQLGPAYSIEDYDLSNEEQRNWWTFQNHLAHLDAELTQNSQVFVFPFF